MSTDSTKPRKVKCLVWDLDRTVWDGVLLEGDELALRPGVEKTIVELDNRGILHSIASRNDPQAALAQLARFGLDHYFLFPQIGWNPKSASVTAVAEQLNIGIDTLAFIDDQPFERDEVSFALPQVLCLDADAVADLPGLPEFTPAFLTDESRLRRAMYQSSVQRTQAEQEFTGGDEEFLRTLGMVFTIRPVDGQDLQRAEELTIRTNQLNSTGRMYSYDDLDRLSTDPGHLLLVAGLEDRYGGYGTIGLTLVEKGPEAWTVKLLLMSCRVMSRGVGTVLLNHLMRLAREAGVRLEADFVPNDRNRIMFVTYRFAGFEERGGRGDGVVLVAPDGPVPAPPDYLTVLAER